MAIRLVAGLRVHCRFSRRAAAPAPPAAAGAAGRKTAAAAAKGGAPSTSAAAAAGDAAADGAGAGAADGDDEWEADPDGCQHGPLPLAEVDAHEAACEFALLECGFKHPQTVRAERFSAGDPSRMRARRTRPRIP
jgi:hypothetical protein